MPSISPHRSFSIGEEDQEKTEEIKEIPSPRKSSGSPGSTFSERLKAARKLIPSYPGRAKLVRSVSESSGQTANTSPERIHCQANGEINASNSSNQEFRTFFREHSIIMEFKHLGQNALSGVYVMPSLKSLQVWHGIIFIRAGPYRDGIFRFILILQDDFPDSRPLLKFTTPIFHPQVSASGVLNLDGGFPDWQRGKNTIWQILKFTKTCFYKVDTWGGVNEEAINVVHSNFEGFKEKAKECAADALSFFDAETEHDNNSDDDGNVLRQKNLSDWAFREGKRMMLNGELPYLDVRDSSP